MQEKMLPQNIEAEVALLGAMINYNEIIDEVAEVVREEYFYLDNNRVIFRSLTYLYSQGKKIDLIYLSEEVTKERDISKYELTCMTNAVMTSDNWREHSNIIKEKYILRRVIEQSRTLEAKCFTPSVDVDGVVSEAERDILSIADTSTNGFRLSSFSDLMDRNLASLELVHLHKGEVSGLKTGYEELDNLTSGFQPGDLIIIAARPSVGKTTLALNIAEHISMNEKKPVLFFSLEMSEEQLGNRVISARSGVAYEKMKSGFMEADEWQSIVHSGNELKDAPLHINDQCNLTQMNLRHIAKKAKREHDIKVLIVDYMQLLRYQGKKVERRDLEVAEFSRELKAIAKDLSIPVIALSQLNRGVEARSDEKPRLSDLRESGSIEQDADVVILMSKRKVSSNADEFVSDESPEVLIDVAKQRNGPCGWVWLEFDKATVKFKDKKAYNFD
jgi:replicative DNA helicase